MKNKILKADIDAILSSEFIDIKAFAGKSILVTGATGMIASMFIFALLEANKKLGTNIKILALARNKAKFEGLFKDYLCDNFIFKEYDILGKISNIEGDVDYIIHTANSTSSQDFLSKPVEVIEQIITGTKNILELAKEKDVESLVYLSSMEVYGQLNFELEESVKEAEYGYIDALNERSSYSQGKRMAETLCYAYFKEYNMPVKIARLVQTLGANVDYNDNRVFAYFARSVVESKDIILRTQGKTIRNYCYITDAIIAIFKILLSTEDGQSYNVANKDSAISIKEMAAMLCEKYKTSKLKIEIDNKNRGFNPEMKLVVDTTKLESLKWQAKVNLAEMFDKIIQSFKNERE